MPETTRPPDALVPGDPLLKTDPLLETDKLTRRFGALAAVDGVSLRFAAGKVHAIIGPNGAGKSTFLSLLAGEQRKTSGKVHFEGLDITRASPERIARLGLLRSYQTAKVFPDLTCAECLWLAAQACETTSLRFFAKARSYSDIVRRSEQALNACGLEQRRLTLARELSYGEQRQLELGMLVATSPRFLLLDEPLAGLSHGEAQRVIALLRELSKGRGIVLVEHDMDAVFSLADEVTVLVSGRVLQTGTPAEIRQSPAVREAYLGSDHP